MQNKEIKKKFLSLQNLFLINENIYLSEIIHIEPVEKYIFQYNQLLSMGISQVDAINILENKGISWLKTLIYSMIDFPTNLNYINTLYNEECNTLTTKIEECSKLTNKIIEINHFYNKNQNWFESQNYQNNSINFIYQDIIQKYPEFNWETDCSALSKFPILEFLYRTICSPLIIIGYNIFWGLLLKFNIGGILIANLLFVVYSLIITLLLLYRRKNYRYYNLYLRLFNAKDRLNKFFNFFNLRFERDKHPKYISEFSSGHEIQSYCHYWNHGFSGELLKEKVKLHKIELINNEKYPDIQTLATKNKQAKSILKTLIQTFNLPNIEYQIQSVKNLNQLGNELLNLYKSNPNISQYININTNNPLDKELLRIKTIILEHISQNIKV